MATVNKDFKIKSGLVSLKVQQVQLMDMTFLQRSKQI
jgi:hypothetical protein